MLLFDMDDINDDVNDASTLTVYEILGKLSKKNLVNFR